MSQLLEQRLEQLEKKVVDHDNDIKELERRVSNHDTSLARIELMVENLQEKWSSLEKEIREALDNKTQQAWKEVTIEAIKSIGYVAVAILAGKIFL